MITKRLFSISLSVKSAASYKDALQFVTESQRWTYKEVNVIKNQRYSQAYAVGLLEMGLKKGDSLST